ncbi:Tol-Pal system protein TolQ [Bathymodiolus thermophilus thioautotrophic gill symbiont]|jgi:biopolymer transport protein TolQ|uniref:Tol-Pal system, TolQ n=3 Tax=sulfur-oxidizing symbionts TaxID=32036 RepID=A0A1H6LN52_9GAMM|nr:MULTISPECIES: protein TolQ [sulfur-oxidizing symbionts]CAC9510170.1 Tol-Pal system protein TolQ [uncultured Gammaproteobacteria bacterium]CAB5497387.1 Tol-Pal system protein TolQ [Bathymodiolus thermophilus thioautotrophic gill symbiont]CAB5498603.1 Tol-Pal system protein TolQ [Bathymodiolus azoricus thioautotrophic gill symbiont]CAC9512419.1 Tol-Pal system protein TolQ [uncultured Gammaproteobacteria bacterium]CAC9523242.1 Tol-Pal system protein TolQ [uncultured Gammaproteobacteria bacteri
MDNITIVNSASVNDSISILGLIVEADFVVQLVMLILVMMSIYSWTVILSKKKILLDSKRDIKNFSAYFSTDKTLNELQSQIPSSSTMADIFSSGYKEFTHLELGDKQANAERAYRLMNTTANSEIERLDSNLSILAMIASSSPYIGLFGTVWGIMHSFIGLASVKQASIAVVAPGIAEALIATAFGLFAAIPATIAYNRLSSKIGDISHQYTAFIEKMFVIFQR